MSALRTRLKQQYPRRARLALAALLLVILPLFYSVSAGFAQSAIPDFQLNGSTNNGYDQKNLSPQASKTDATTPSSPYTNDAYTTRAVQYVEQNQESLLGAVERRLKGEMGQANDVFLGLDKFWSDDIVTRLFRNFWQLIGKWVEELLNGPIADAVQFLSACLRTFVLNPNVAINGLNGSQDDQISHFIREAADVMYGIAVDVLLLLFVLCIWKFWAEAAWRGGGNLMGAVGRLIFTAGLLLAWPTLYAFEIQISNEMIKAIYFNTGDQVAKLDVALSMAIKAGLVATAAGLANVFAPAAMQALGGAVLGGGGGLVLGTVGGFVAFVALIIFSIISAILIGELVYLLILKSIQTALLCAQYMFGPIFLVFFATPDTEGIAAGYVKAFVEVSLWTFVWVGLLKLMTIVVASSFNPWGKVLVAVGILQLMIQVPSFLARAQISPMSDFISAGLITGGLLMGLKAMSGAVSSRAQQFADYIGNQQFGARGLKPITDQASSGLPGSNHDGQAFESLRAAFAGKPPADGKKATDPNNLVPPAKDGLRFETKEEKEKREQEEAARRQAQGAQANLAQQGQTGQPGATAGQPATTGPTLATGAAGAATPGTPGAGNMAAAALGATPMAAAAALGAAALARGAADPTMVPKGAGPSLADLQSAKIARDPKDPVENPGPLGMYDPAIANNYAGYKFVNERIQANNMRIFDGMSSQTSPDDKYHWIADSKGNGLHMQTPPGASPVESQRMWNSVAHAARVGSDPAALDAARAAAIEAGEDQPQGMAERVAAGIMAYNGGSWKSTSAAKQRFSRSLAKHAFAGSQSFVMGESGNAYTEYLDQLWGGFNPQADAWSAFIMTTAESASSPYNPNHMTATKAAVDAGFVPNEINRNAFAHPVVKRQAKWQQPLYARAIGMYAEMGAREVYGNGEDSLTQMQRDAYASGVIMNRMDDADVFACVDEYVSTGGEGGSFNPVRAIMRSPVYKGNEDWKRPPLNLGYISGIEAAKSQVRSTGSALGVRFMVPVESGGNGGAWEGPMPDDLWRQVEPMLDNSKDFHAGVAQTIVEMCHTGFSQEQIREPQVVNLAYSHMANGQSHMLPYVKEAARVMGPANTDPGTVQAVYRILDGGVAPNHITQEYVFSAMHAINDPSLAPDGINRKFLENHEVDLAAEMYNHKLRLGGS